jgi:hypothetical protein
MIGPGVAAALTLIFFTLPQVSRCDTASATLAFDQGHYADAAEGFLEVGRKHGWSASRLYDWANANARQGNWGPAVLGYRRAQLLDPGDADISANLRRVRALAQLPAPADNGLLRVIRSVSLPSWSFVLLGGVWLLCLTLAFLVLGPSRRVGVACSAAAALVVLAAGVGFGAQRRAAMMAIVTAHGGAELRISPFDGATPEGHLMEGEQVRPDARHGAFEHVRIEDPPREGWVEASEIEGLISGST